ncbi:MAG TPA: T9SS type A sorting domain-containing protein [Fluviicola sp.]|nr:T9SS type A sorting domain-containing protein [Fluviicola sp.]
MKLFSVFVVLLLAFSGFAQPTAIKQKVPVISATRAAGCAPPNKTTYLELNNVRAMVHTAGNLWQVPGQNFSQYEIPKNSRIMALFTSALWLGGTDVNGQLKLAALRYRDGQDYWTGPLSEETAEIDPQECSKYDQHYITSQDLVREFDAWFSAGELDQQNGTNLQATNFPNYKIPDFFKTWPAHGDVTKGQNFYLAPFYDRDQNGIYEWEKGDYPWYDLHNTKNCKEDRRVSLYGDLNFWWVLNDKGNIHTETGGQPIGIEIHAQAFAFATNDDVNNMTFYNYELINRGTQTLYNTYFGVFVDGALGDPFDDYVGCDVNRGLGYFYNGDNNDGDNLGFYGYGTTPPAVGVDFFEGPYQDNDTLDNAFGIGTNEALNGIGYGDGIIDNERFGMRRFLYYINNGGGANPSQTDPTSASDYYNFLRGRWKDNTPFYYGGNGHISDPDANPTLPCDFMFPGDTDPLGWGTGGNPQPVWTEQTANNLPYDRRFLQSAGPFILKPGAVNNITVGVVWARAASGDPFESVRTLQKADDRAQALFENCFKVLDGPHAPDLSIQEMSNGLILSLSNSSSSNNYGEKYEEFDPFIVADSTADKFYRFQGYLIYQLRSNEISVSDLEDPTKARLVAQCDKKDGVDRLVNFEFDEDLQASIPVEKVDGANEGIKHSFLVTEDQFAVGDRRLVNFKSYYYMAVSYAYNNYKTYLPDQGANLDGQKLPFLGSRKAAIGEVKAVIGIPHNPVAEASGTMHYAEYGFQPSITRIDGWGNGMNFTDISAASEQTILQQGSLDELTYAENRAPINVKIIDPLNVAGGYFSCKFREPVSGNIDSSTWVIYRYNQQNGTLLDSVTSESVILESNEQLIPKWGISVEITQHEYYQVAGSVPDYRKYPDPIGSTITFADSSKRWLSFVEDDDAFFPTNWIRNGVFIAGAAEDDPSLGYLNPACYNDFTGIDPERNYSKFLNGGITHFSLVGRQCAYMPIAIPGFFTSAGSAASQATLARASGVDIVITSDKSKWTRCAVIELCSDANLAIGGSLPGTLRGSQSVDKEGNPDNSGTTGMGWFPGYAIDVETGNRLHMAFGENSFLGSDNGSDMIWNPTSRIVDDNGTPVMGGMHPVYVFGVGINNTACPNYDGNNNWVYDQYANENNLSYRELYTNLMWVFHPIHNTTSGFMSTDVRMKVRLNKEYAIYNATGQNNGRPMYGWSMDNYRTDLANTEAAASVLDLINIVPNPYYAFSEYERNKVDTRVKITNLPHTCTVSIYNLSGKLINQFKKDNDITYLDWALTNKVGIPVSSGVYIIHVDVPGVGEVTRKVFIGMRQPDLEGF